MSDEVFGMKKGESIAMERHGEMGVLYRPVTQMTLDELALYGKVYEAWGDRDLGGRDNVVALVADVLSDQPDETRAKVMAYIDELHTLGGE